MENARNVVKIKFLIKLNQNAFVIKIIFWLMDYALNAKKVLNMIEIFKDVFLFVKKLIKFLMEINVFALLGFI